MSISILDHVPKGITLREVQVKALLEIEANFHEYDAIILRAPVASGKSIIAMVVAAWQESTQSVGILTPRALLQDQYQRDFPTVPSLKGKTKYKCKSKGYRSCGDFFEAAGYYCCKGRCSYIEAVKTALDADKLILNFHSHLFGGIARDLYKDVVIIDEAHNLVPMLSDIYTLQIWRHKDNYPYDTNTKDNIIMWLETSVTQLNKNISAIQASYKDDMAAMPSAVRKETAGYVRKRDKYQMVLLGLVTAKELFHVSVTDKAYGRGRRLYPCLEIKPISLASVPHKMWPDSVVKKLLLMSATIFDRDIERLGLARKRVKIIECDSPIPADQRPIIVRPIAPMSYAHRAASTRLLSAYIEKLAEEHTGKGLIHITYSLVSEFQRYLTDPRYVWHTEDTRESAYKEFVKSDGNEILMACGMGEGIDLAGPDFQWQVIAKAMFPSLADPLQKHFTNTDPLVYSLETVRATIQQSGRICRTPTDYGITYIIDKSFAKFYRGGTKLSNGKYQPHYTLFPEYFRDSMKWESA